ncbi:MAG: DUF3619 family protein [Geobacteraceae bacterium]|nr:DUF3619 family protein [Geobacteraceae bacterium]
MMSEENDKAFVQNLRKVLDETEAQMDPRIRMRLRSARLKALESLKTPVPWYDRFPRWVTAGGLATAMVLVLTLSLWTSSDHTTIPSGQVEDLEILTTQEQMELYKDLDFYRWLETSDHLG